MKLKITYLFVCLLGMIFSETVIAQKLTASAPSQVQVGQRFQVTWELNGNGSNFVAPEITDFQVLGGPNQSTAMQFVNGTMSQSISYSYVLRAAKTGEFTIAPAKIKLNGNVIESNALTVNVVQGQPQQQSQQSSGGQQQQQQAKSSSSNNDLFARVEVSKKSAYLGEKITVDLKIYNRVSLVNLDGWKLPSFEGFWSKETSANQQFQWQNEVVDGVQYQTGLVKQYVVYPQKTGEVTIDPMEFVAVVRERSSGRSRSVFDQFFGGYEDFQRSVKSNSVTINVKPYPSGKPSDFSGLSGNLKMTASLDKTETKSNEAVNLKVTVSGEGNLYQLQAPDLEFPPDIEVYDPKVSDNIKVGANGVSGSRTFEYVLIPRYAGEFKIGPFSFSYFNPSTGTFKTDTQDAFDLIVEKGDADEPSSPSLNITNKEDIQLIGSDIRYIKQGQYPIENGSSFFYRSVPFYGAVGVPILLFVLLIGYAEYQRSQGNDLGRLKSKKATGLAKKRLTKAKKLWDDNQTALFYEEVFKALSDYAADKFQIPVSALSKDKIKSVLATKNVPEETVIAFIGVLDKTEFARFAPGADKQMGSVYDEALAAIVNVENHA
ncbi:MAG: BatD family protein [Flavobacteriales bacterium]|nr:BatD family protein [Flavobacteriales bacterium]